MRRVVVTGIGMCTPLGYGAEFGWEKLINSKSGIRKLEGFQIDDLSSQVGGQIPREGRSELFPENVIEHKEKKKMEPFIQYALIAAKEAIKDSGWEVKNDKDSERTGVMVGSGIGGLDGIRMSSESLAKKSKKNFSFLFLLV